MNLECRFAQNRGASPFLHRHFTIHHSEVIDRVIAEHLTRIAYELVTTIDTLRSLVLIGGFGRGEGSVIIEHDRVIPLNDYDIVLITDIPPGDLKTTVHKLSEAIGIRHIDLIPILYAETSSLPPTQFNFDMKYGGYTFWGEDLLPSLPCYDRSEITRQSAQSLLVNRMICLLESYKSAFRDRRPNEQEHFFLCQQVAKAVIALGEALLIDRIQYHFSARCRKQLISDLFPDEKQFVGLHEWSINFKLLPNQHRSVDAVHYWHAAVNQYVNQLPRFLYVDEPILFFLSQDQAMTSIYRYLSGCENADPKAALEKSELSLLAAEATEEPLKSLFTKMAVRHLEKAAVSVPPRVDWDDIRQLAVSTWHRRFH